MVNVSSGVNVALLMLRDSSSFLHYIGIISINIWGAIHSTLISTACLCIEKTKHRLVDSSTNLYLPQIIVLCFVTVFNIVLIIPFEYDAYKHRFLKNCHLNNEIDVYSMTQEIFKKQHY